MKNTTTWSILGGGLSLLVAIVVGFLQFQSWGAGAALPKIDHLGDYPALNMKFCFLLSQVASHPFLLLSHLFLATFSFLGLFIFANWNKLILSIRRTVR